MIKRIPMDHSPASIKAMHRAGSHCQRTGVDWFDPGAGRFFGSRYASHGFARVPAGDVYFVASSRYDERSARMYTVHRLDAGTGEIDTVCIPGHEGLTGTGFQGFKSREAAERAARKLAAGEEI